MKQIPFETGEYSLYRKNNCSKITNKRVSLVKLLVLIKKANKQIIIIVTHSKTALGDVAIKLFCLDKFYKAYQIQIII